jgi:hypothetical protein
MKHGLRNYKGKYIITLFMQAHDTAVVIQFTLQGLRMKENQCSVDMKKWAAAPASL